MTPRLTVDEIRERTYKRRDSWWTVWLVDPVAVHLVRLIAPWRWVTPNRLSLLAFGVGLGAAACFWAGWLIAGALLFHVAFLIDCLDGKIARLNGTGSVFGVWLDYIFDRLRVVICALGLFGGQWQRTGDPLWIGLAGLVIFLDLFRYLNALQMGKIRELMRGDGPEPADVHGNFRARFGLFGRARGFLLAHRIRAHVFSGIEFMMFVFVLGPLTGLVVPFTVVAAVLLTAFELLLIYKLWLTTRTYSAEKEALIRT
ncbi:CDP-alcohol phosphatidyltransferase family protein [Actinoplanes hulinensis]|uniref:CDP-alcohol phosphatidyltransferase family protein n=1 Tax=Actinoplanes hulinensis TaxID=1144547 RepID=A0ABS7B3D7_9ACTN|nr:CDP-alcohol phosphatidyltransferase family protein [Actinoplanes hulinensis]MBW6435510.1 CDP-alcohol phosphatidyltransferase family protein [Actinoplanes hulinensis]